MNAINVGDHVRTAHIAEGLDGQPIRQENGGDPRTVFKVTAIRDLGGTPGAHVLIYVGAPGYGLTSAGPEAWERTSEPVSIASWATRDYLARHAREGKLGMLAASLNIPERILRAVAEENNAHKGLDMLTPEQRDTIAARMVQEL